MLGDARAPCATVARMLPLLATLVALACAAASARRLWFVTHATAVHPEHVLAALTRTRGKVTLAELRAAALGDVDGAHESWECDLFDALERRDENERIALVNEQLTEL